MKFKFVGLPFVTAVFLLFFNIATISAQQADPRSTMEAITNNLMDSLSKNREKIKKNPDLIYDLVDHLIIPHIDFVEMAKWVAGKQAWRTASQDDRSNFIEEFKTLVIRTYTTALHKYTDEKIEYLP